MAKKKIKRKCSKCGRPGHYAPTCKQKKKTLRKKTKTSRKKKSKKKTSRTPHKPKIVYWVNANYSTKKHGWGTIDSKMRKAAGRSEMGAGTMMQSGKGRCRTCC